MTRASTTAAVLAVLLLACGDPGDCGPRSIAMSPGELCDSLNPWAGGPIVEWAPQTGRSYADGSCPSTWADDFLAQCLRARRRADVGVTP